MYIVYWATKLVEIDKYEKVSRLKLKFFIVEFWLANNDGTLSSSAQQS